MNNDADVLVKNMSKSTMLLKVLNIKASQNHILPISQKHSASKQVKIRYFHNATDIKNSTRSEQVLKYHARLKLSPQKKGT